MKNVFQNYITLLSLFAVLLLSPVSLLAEGTSNSPTVTLSPASWTVTEGNSGSQSQTFTISIDECPYIFDLNIRVRTRNGTANSGSDYDAFTQNLVFAASLSCTQSVDVSIQVNGDTIVEGNENFYLDIIDNGTNTNQNFTFGPQTSTITITNDDTSPNANLRISKSNDKSPNKVVLGDQILYTVVATNDGPQSTTIQVKDIMPTGLSLDSINIIGNPSNFACNGTPTIICTGSKVFAAGESVTIEIRADVDAYDSSYGIDRYRNRVIVSSPEGKPDSNTANNSVNNDVRIHKIDVRVTKSTSTPVVANIGDPIVFNLTARNNSPQKSRISFNDVLPAGMTLVGVTLNSGPADFTCTANIGANTVTCGGTHEFIQGEIANITINATAAINGRHYNTATVSSPNGYPDSNTNNNSATTHVDVGNNASANDVAISKNVSAPFTIDPNTGLPAYYVGDTVTFTVTAQNFGIDSRFKINDFKNSSGTTSGAFTFSNLNCSTTVGSVVTRPNANNSTVNQCINSAAYDVPDGTIYTLTIDAELTKVGTVCNRARAYKGFPGADGSTNWSLNKTAQRCITVIAHDAPPVLHPTNFNITPDEAITPIDLKDHTTDSDTPTANLSYSNATGLPTGLSMSASGVISGTYVHPGRGPVAGPFTFSVTVTDPQGLSDTDSFTITLVPPDIQANDNVYSVPIFSVFSGNLITEQTTASLGTTYFPDVGVDLQVTGINNLTPTNPSTFTWASDGSFTYDANTTASGSYDFIQYTIEDKYGQTASAVFYVVLYTPSIGATDDNYLTGTNTPLSGNVILDDTGNGSDVGDGINIIANTTTAHGSLNLNADGTFTYNPDLNYTGNDSFTYKITDNYDQESNATVTIVVGSFALQQYADFTLVNPPDTRNIIGSFITTGNTVECVTDKLGDINEIDSFNGTCSNNIAKNNNNFMTKYIDIDGNATVDTQQTWNSSTATFTLPANYDQQGGNGIAWAALFWQGSVNNRAYYKQRRAYPDNGTYAYDYVTSNQVINLTNTDANKVLISMDGAATYTPIESDTFYYDSVHSNASSTYGGYYAAYANITALVQSYNLSQGDHTLTVANITTNEGREKNVGNYGGWSLVIIYKEDVFNGKPRNISIYNGYQAIGYPGSGSTQTTSAKVLPISGFKLPKSGAVNASISAFVGEGEQIYGGSAIVFDKMTLTDVNDTNYSIASGSNNVFDATLAGVTRPSGNSNDVTNTNGIDIDTYDISAAMTTIRNNDENTSSVSIGIASKDTDTSNGDDSDYVTASMLAFSAELYKPQICYDYTLDIDGFILESNNNEIDTSFGDQGLPLTTRISIKSEEGDFVLRDVNISYKINNTAQVRYINDSVAIAPNGIYSYVPAGTTGLNQAYDQTNQGFGLYIGEGANAVPGPGGSIDAFETRYIRLRDEMLHSDINTSFELSMTYLVNYGSGDLELTQLFNATTECNATGVYYPARGTYNVTSAQATDVTSKPYNLYTQVASREFKVKVFSYDDDFTTLKPVSNSVEIEMFNAGYFNRDINISCYNPDGNITSPSFVRFNNTKVEEISNIRYDGAIRNTGFRIWLLLKPDGSTLENNCTSRSTPANCFNNLYTSEYTGFDTFCTTECALNNSGCYACLRKYYGKPICSRDNFSVRPETFVTTIIDSNQDPDTTTGTQLHIADTKIGTAVSPNPQDNNASLVAGYSYRFDINATNYLDDTPVRGYHQYFNQSHNANYAKMTWNPDAALDSTKCNDTNEQNISVLLFDGSTISGTTAHLQKVNQVGKYAFELRDENWTAVDWHPTLTTHHTPVSDFNNGNDCLSSGFVDLVNTGVRQGCYTDSVHTHPNGAVYEKLYTQYFPYGFNMSGLVIGEGPTNDRGFVYMNDLNSTLYPPTGDENMSYNIQGTFSAVDFENLQLSNFVKGCYADDINLSLDYTILFSNDAIPFNYDVGYNNPTTSTQISKTQASASNAPALNVATTATVLELASTFEKDANGSVNLDLGFNFNKDNVNPSNPRRIQFNDFNISYASSPALTVNGSNTYIIESNSTIDSNVSFFYAKIKPGQSFYDGITGLVATTPVSVVIYCDLGFALCNQRGINTASGQTDEYNWWKSWTHDNIGVQQDGNIVFQAPAQSTLSTTAPGIDNRGENTALTLTRDNPVALPLTVPVNLETDNTLPSYTDRWLIYNPSNVAPLPPLYKVRFIGGANWAGHGETGSVVGGNLNNAKSGRVEW